jgi:hypothetical protein
MPFPTTSWGNQGATLGFPTALTSAQQAYVVNGLPGPTASLPGSTDGPQIGGYTLLPDGTYVQFLQAGAGVASGNVCKISTAVAWQNNFTVINTAAANDGAVAVNDRAGIALLTNYCTYFTRQGLAFALTLNAVAAGKIVAASGVAGQLYGATAGTDLQAFGVNTVLVGASPAASPVLIF